MSKLMNVEHTTLYLDVAETGWRNYANTLRRRIDLSEIRMARIRHRDVDKVVAKSEPNETHTALRFDVFRDAFDIVGVAQDSEDPIHPPHNQ